MEDSKEDVKAPTLLERAKEEIDAVVHREKKHSKETHGLSDDIDENTPVDKVKGPNVFERAKEEIEALVGTIHPKKEHGHEHDSRDDGGCLGSLGRGLEKFCSPSCRKSD